MAAALLWLAEVVLVLFDLAVALLWLDEVGLAPFSDVWRWMAAALLWLVHVADQWRLTALQTVIFPSVCLFQREAGGLEAVLLLFADLPKLMMMAGHENVFVRLDCLKL